MDKPIAVGDLVMVVRSCCVENLGTVFRVAEIDWSRLYRCRHCGGVCNGIAVEGWGKDKNGAFLHELKRIDPDNLKDDVPERENLHEPA